jgi:hypothetical protein
LSNDTLTEKWKFEASSNCKWTSKHKIATTLHGLVNYNK